MTEQLRLEIAAKLSKSTIGIEEGLRKMQASLDKKGLTKVKIQTQLEDGKVNKAIMQYEDNMGNAVQTTLDMTKATKDSIPELRVREKVTQKTAEAVKKSVSVTKLHAEALKENARRTKEATKSNKGLFSGLAEGAKTAIQYALGLGLIYKALQEIGKGIQYIKELDVEMRNIQIVAGYTDEEISSLAVSYNELAKAMGATTLEVANGSLEWTRQGKSIAETQELLRSTLMLSKLGNVDTAQSTEYLTSILNGFKLEAKDTESVVSKLVAVDNAAATSVEELATAMQKSSVSAQAAGVDLDTLIAYIGTVSSITRLSAQTVGTSFKTMFARFQDIKEGALDGEGAINNVERALGRVTLASGEQMSIMNRQTGEFKDFSIVIEQLAGEWDNLTEMEQANIVKAFAGVRQRESFLALMENQEMMHGLLGEAMDSEGLAADRYAIYLEGLEAAQNKSTAAWEGMVGATVDGGLIKWFYDAQAGLFGFIEAFGGLDTLLAGISAGLVTYGVGMLSAEVATGGLALAWNALTVAIAANPLGILAVAIAAVTIAAIDLNSEIEKSSQKLNDDWANSLKKVADETKSSDAVVKEFAKDVEYLNGLGFFEGFGVDEQETIEAGLKSTVALLKETSTSWEDYEDSTRAAAKAAGYLVDEEGRLYTSISNGTRVFKAYNDDVELVSQGMYEATTATDGWMAGTRDLSKELETTESRIEDVSAMTQNFQRILESAFAGDDGSIDEKFKPLFDNLSTTNELYQQGYLDMNAYFSQLEESLDSVDVSTLFGEDDTEASEAFFSGLVENSLTAFDTINASFENGSISLTEYTEQLAGWGDSLLKIEEIAADLGFGEILQEAMGGISGAVGELTGALELNAAVEDSLYQMSQGHMEWASTAYADRAKMLGRLAAESAYTITDMEGNVLNGAKNIEGWLMQSEGNMANFATQTAAQTGSSVNNLVKSAGDMLQSFAKSMGSFKASIKFVPDVSNNISFAGMFENWKNGGGLTLPTFGYNIEASGSVSTPKGGSDYDGWMAGGAGGSAFESAGTPSISDMVGNFGEMLSGSDYGSDWGADMYDQTDIATRAFDGFGDSAGSVISQMQDLAKESGKTAKQVAEDAKSIDALLAMVVKKIKQEQKARKEALKEQLAGYKDIIDKRKDLLDTMQDEVEYQRKLEDNQRELSTIQSELVEIELDDSEEAAARRRALQEEEAEIKEEIAEDEADRSVELQKEALDDEYDTFKTFIDGQVDAIDNYLASNGAIVGDALNLIGEKGESLYSDLSNWNSEYGSGIQQDVVTAWDDAYEAISKYAGGLAAITGNAITMPSADGASAPTSGFTADMGLDTSNLVESNLSSMAGGLGEITNQGGGMTIDKFLELNVAGNLDSSVMPEIEAIAKLAVEQINEAMRDRGYGQRGAGQYSI